MSRNTDVPFLEQDEVSQIIGEIFGKQAISAYLFPIL